MPSLESTRGAPAVNPATSELDLLGFVEAGIAVETRPDIGAIEIVVRDHEQVARPWSWRPSRRSRSPRGS